MLASIRLMTRRNSARRRPDAARRPTSALGARGWLLCLGLAACAPALSNYQLGVDALDAGDEELAETHFVAALNDEADAQRAQEQLDELWLAQARAYEYDKPERAADEYRRILIRDPGAKHARMRLGALLETSGDIDAAIYNLSQDPACRQCAAQAAALQSQRGNQRIKAGDFAGAHEDFSAAVAAAPAPHDYLSLVLCFTRGQIGTAEQAAEHLNAAYPLIAGNAQLQDRWARTRVELVRVAAAARRFQAARDALAAEDPRVQVDASVRARDTFALRLDFAEADQAAGNIDDGLRFGKEVWQQMQSSGHPIDPELRDRVVALYLAKINSLTQAGRISMAVDLAKEATASHPSHPALRLVSALVVAEVDVQKGHALLEMIEPVDTKWRRVEALIHVIDARKRMEAGELAKAKKLIDRAQSSFPDLLDARLAYAQWLALDDFSGLSRKDKQRLESEGLVDYPSTPSRHGQALAELLWVKARYEEPAQMREPLRMPGFRGWLARLETELRGLLPYEARKLPGEEPRLIISNTRPSPLTVSVDGPGLDEQKEIMPGEQATFVFDRAGLVRLELPEGRKALLAEAWTGLLYAP